MAEMDISEVIEKAKNNNDLDGFKLAEFVPLKDEKNRAYTYRPLAGESDFVNIIIPEPLALLVTKSGGHMIEASGGMCHYIRPGWICISWQGSFSAILED